MDNHAQDVANVLMVKPTPRARFAIEALTEDITARYKFFFQNLQPSSSGFTSLQDYLEDSREIILRKKIDIVLSFSDTGALLKAALAQEFPHLQGPSVESFFLAHHKFYTRCYLDPSPIPFALLDLASADLDKACEEALEVVGIPAFFKPTSYCGASGTCSVGSAEELKHFSKAYIHSDMYTDEDVDTQFMVPFYVKNFDVEKYPLAIKSTAIVEKHMGDAAKINADGYVFKGDIFHWSISDNVFSLTKPSYCFGATHPTKLSKSRQQNIWEVFDAIVGRMIDFGYDNEFVNIEFFVLDSGEIMLMEVNPRRSGNLQVSGMVFTNGDVTAAQLKLAQGINPGIPIPNGKHAFFCYIRTYGSGKAREFYDFSYSYPDLLPEVDPNDFIDGSGESGTILSRMYLSGDSQQEVLDKYREICSCVLLQQELSMWK